MTPREHQQAFLETLGHAITQWQAVEMELFRIFARLVRCERYNTASAAFHSVVNFGTRLDMTHAAALVELGDSPLLKTWNSLYNRLYKRSKRRNHLAHFMLLYEPAKTGELVPTI